jgi:general secretion pathway protein B
MSYILDALKKSDQQRQLGATPTLMTAQAAVGTPRQPRLIRNAVLVSALVCIGILIGWFQPWRPNQPVAKPAPVASGTIVPVHSAAAPAPVTPVPEMTAKTDSVPPMQNAGSVEQSEIPSDIGAMKQAMPVTAESEPPVEQAQPLATAPKEAETARPGDAVEEKKVVELNDLPASVQQGIPNISISFHAYSSSPKDRHVMINGAMLGQGDLLAPGLSLDEVTPDGVILGYKGYRIHRGVR